MLINPTPNIALIMPSIRSVNLAYSYRRIQGLSQVGFPIDLYYPAEVLDHSADKDALNLERELGINVIKIPSSRLKISDFLREYYCSKRKKANFRLTVKYLWRSIRNNGIRKGISNLLRFAPLIFNEPDIVHFDASYLTSGMFSGVVGMAKPIIISLRGADVDEKPISSQRWRELIADMSSNSLTTFHCVSEYVKNKAISLGVPDEKIEVIYIGVPIQELPTRRHSENVDRLICIARLSHEKGVDVLINTLDLLRNRGYLLTLSLFGDGPERQRLEELVTKLNLNNVVTFFGEVENKLIMKFILDHAASSIYIQPSRLEAFATAILESMSVGLPIIASKVGGIPEQVIENWNGLLVERESPDDLANAIVDLMEDEEKRMMFRKNSRKLIKEKFSSQTEATKFVELYESHLL